MAPCEWVIDIIKEWVQNQLYATQAWVLEWITPYNVTGDITPDATCTYFKAGTYGEKPYYKRQDGTYYIWWNEAVVGWIISVTPGNMGGGWWIQQPLVPGLYDPFGAYTGIATVAEGRKFLCTSYVDRGDPATFDFSHTALTQDGTWRELDLSSIVPENAVAVSLIASARHPDVGKRLYFRKHGNVNAQAFSGIKTLVALLFHNADLTVAVDADRKIDYLADAPATWFLFFTVKGWWL